MVITRLLILIKKIKRKKEKKNTIDYVPKWRKIKKKKTQNNPLLIPAAAVASRPSLSPLLIAEPLPYPEPGKLLRLSPL